MVSSCRGSERDRSPSGPHLLTAGLHCTTKSAPLPYDCAVGDVRSIGAIIPLIPARMRLDCKSREIACLESFLARGAQNSGWGQVVLNLEVAVPIPLEVERSSSVDAGCLTTDSVVFQDLWAGQPSVHRLR